MKSKIGLLFLILALSNCASFGNYWKDRGKNAMDIIDISVDKLNAGVTVQAGPIYTGLGTGGGLSYGLVGGEVGEHSSVAAAFVIPVDRVQAGGSGSADVQMLHRLYKRKKYFKAGLFVEDSDEKIPDKLYYYTKIRISAGVFIGASVAVNVGEIFDFLLGFLTIDISGDDYYSKNMDEFWRDEK